MSLNGSAIDRRDFLTRAALAGVGLGCLGMGLPMGLPMGLGGLPERGTRANAALRPFNMLVLGDSYISQPGLLPEERSWSLVAAQFADQLAGFREIRPPRVFARSGAEIRIEIDTPDNMDKDRQAPWPGEGVPDAFWEDPHPNGDSYSSPSIWRQLARAYCDGTRRTFVKPSEVDLVLVSGGGNDVTLGAIMNPFRAGNGQAWLRQLTRDVLGVRMKPLLQQVASAFPSARIVVMGYPQLVSNQTADGELMKYLAALGVLAAKSPVGGGLAATAPAIKNTLRQQTEAFAEESSKELQLAVDEANAMHRGRLVFADVRTVWTEANAYGAPESHFWLFNAPATPPDHTHGPRYEICKTHGKFIDMATDIECAQGAMGHLNVDGARAHASAAIAALEKFGVGWLGLKAMAVCVDATMVGAPTSPEQSKDETFSIVAHARDAVTNAPLNNATVEVTGRPAGPVEFGVRLQPCRKSGFLAGCLPLTFTIRSTGYAKVIFQAADIFGGNVPGSSHAPPAAMGQTFHFCAPQTKVGEPFDDTQTPNPTFACNPPPPPRGQPRPGPIPRRP